MDYLNITNKREAVILLQKKYPYAEEIRVSSLHQECLQIPISVIKEGNLLARYHYYPVGKKLKLGEYYNTDRVPNKSKFNWEKYYDPGKEIR